MAIHLRPIDERKGHKANEPRRPARRPVSSPLSFVAWTGQQIAASTAAGDLSSPSGLRGGLTGLILRKRAEAALRRLAVAADNLLCDLSMRDRAHGRLNHAPAGSPAASALLDHARRTDLRVEHSLSVFQHLLQEVVWNSQSEARIFGRSCHPAAMTLAAGILRRLALCEAVRTAASAQGTLYPLLKGSFTHLLKSGLIREKLLKRMIDAPAKPVALSLASKPPGISPPPNGRKLPLSPVREPAVAAVATASAKQTRPSRPRRPSAARPAAATAPKARNLGAAPRPESRPGNAAPEPAL